MATFDEFMDLDIRVREIERGSEQGNSVQKKVLRAYCSTRCRIFGGCRANEKIRHSKDIHTLSATVPSLVEIQHRRHL